LRSHRWSDKAPGLDIEGFRCLIPLRVAGYALRGEQRTIRNSQPPTRNAQHIKIFVSLKDAAIDEQRMQAWEEIIAQNS
jgi:hypothetical protein